MTRVEVLAMTDEELGCKAAGLLGLKDWNIDRGPNFANDIAAAWELVELARDQAGYVAKLTTWNGCGPVCQCVFDRPDVNWSDADDLMPRAFVLTMATDDNSNPTQEDRL